MPLRLAHTGRELIQERAPQEQAGQRVTIRQLAHTLYELRQQMAARPDLRCPSQSRSLPVPFRPPPEPSPPVYLSQSKVMYEFADSTLEDLSAGQKILVRSGLDNERRIKAKFPEVAWCFVEPDVTD